LEALRIAGVPRDEKFVTPASQLPTEERAAKKKASTKRKPSKKKKMATMK